MLGALREVEDAVFRKHAFILILSHLPSDVQRSLYTPGIYPPRLLAPVRMSGIKKPTFQTEILRLSSIYSQSQGLTSGSFLGFHSCSSAREPTGEPP